MSEGEHVCSVYRLMLVCVSADPRVQVGWRSKADPPRRDEPLEISLKMPVYSGRVQKRLLIRAAEVTYTHGEVLMGIQHVTNT